VEEGPKKKHKTSVRITYVLAETLTGHLPDIGHIHITVLSNFFLLNSVNLCDDSHDNDDK
jgi:hypothetical protein